MLNNSKKVFFIILTSLFFTAGGFFINTNKVSALSVGDTYGGGKIFYIYSEGEPGYEAEQTNGLISIASDQASDKHWGCSGTQISGADGTAIGTGNQNTIDITAGCATADIAARVASDLDLNGYTDWFLPSINELDMLYANKGYVGWSPPQSTFYWSSSEYDDDSARLAQTQTGGQFILFSSLKEGWARVHVIRSFKIPYPSISNPVISGVTSPSAGEVPVTTPTETNEYTANVTWSENPTTFIANKIYTATITITPKDGYTLTGVPENFFTVDGATSVSNGVDSGIVTAIFPETGSLGIGDYYQGGKVAYILKPSDPGFVEGEIHGLIVSSSAQFKNWGCSGISIPGADGTAIGTGYQNTIDIINNCYDSYIAAEYASDRVEGGYSDWYLPSKDELNKIYLNKSIMAGLPLDYWYWSSSEYDVNNVWMQNFRYGDSAFSSKDEVGYAWLVRSFTYPGTISDPIITGVTRPTKDATPVSTATETDSYTATVSWNGNPTTFKDRTAYTAIITIIPNEGYTLIGVPENFFTVDGATATNATDSGTVTAIFPINVIPSIGNIFQGGKVFYFLKSGDIGYSETETKGLIAAENDEGNGYEWGCNGSPIPGADGTAIGTGYQNTLDIVSFCTWGTSAARVVRASNRDGYNDWYLPSQDELIELYSNRNIFDNFIINPYWSSTETSNSAAWGQNFGGGLGGWGKDTVNNVRAIRSFSFPSSNISISEITGLTVPKKGETPINNLIETDEYTANVSWDGNPTIFAEDTIYTATITIVPKNGFTLTGTPNNFFSVTGATSVTNNADSGIVTAVFPKTTKNKTSSSGSMPSVGLTPAQGTSLISCLLGDLFDRNTGKKCTETSGSHENGENISHYNFTRTLKLLVPRMTGDDVKELQEYLNRNGFNCGIADGVFGSKTNGGVILFQHANGIEEDGSVGPITRAILNK